MTVPAEDRDRVRKNYTDDDNLTVDDVRSDLEDAGFEGESLDAFTEGVAGDEALVESESALRAAQSEAVDSLRDGGAVSSQVVRGRDPDGNRQYTIGSPQNVEQRVERVSDTQGEVIARNTNTGTEGVIGTVEIAEPAREP
jgi:hypothetical protein